MKIKVEDDQLWMMESGHWRKAVWRECWYCGKQFPSADRHDPSFGERGKFCSVQCVGKWKAKQYNRLRPRKKCVICGTQFEVSKSKANRYHTCSNPYCKRAFKRITARKNWEIRRQNMVAEITAKREARKDHSR